MDKDEKLFAGIFRLFLQLLHPLQERKVIAGQLCNSALQQTKTNSEFIIVRAAQQPEPALPLAADRPGLSAHGASFTITVTCLA